MQFNPDEFRADIEELNLSRQQEDALLRSLCEIMSLFVELGYGVNSINSLFPELFNVNKQHPKNSSQ